MADTIIYLLPEGDAGSAFRVKNAPDQKFRAILIDRGETLICKSTISDVVHGTLTPDDDLATLLILEFRFVSTGKSSMRFISSTITLTFEDANENTKDDPIVYRVAPEGVHTLNKTTTSKQIKQSLKLGLTSGITGVGGNVGYQWEMQGTKAHERWTSLTGVKRTLREFGDDNAVIWSMGENENKKDGIPSFLRTAVVLRRNDDTAFSFTIKVDTEVDFVSEVKRLLGLEKADVVDPVKIDPRTNQLQNVGHKQDDLKNMSEMDLGDYVDVMSLL